MMKVLAFIASAMLASHAYASKAVANNRTDAVSAMAERVARRAPFYTAKKHSLRPASNQAVNQSIFIVTSETKEGMSGGTAFLTLTPSGVPVIVTNRHVCEGADRDMREFTLHFQDKTYKAKLAAKSNHADLCLLLPEPALVATVRPLPLQPRPLTPGEAVCVHGHPRLRPITEFAGIFLGQQWEQIGTGEPFRKSTVVLIGCVDFMILPGNSGSPLFNSQDQVAGVVFAYDESGGACRGLFIPTSELIRFMIEVER